jgi:hypothetical protein
MGEVAAQTLELQPAPPRVGSLEMPAWTRAELPDAPRFTWRNWVGLLGPGLLMGGASIGGGEWLLGPSVTARYGAGLLWLATLSIVFQVFYNLEVSRYALYTGEPIFTGKFRTMPGPRFWVVAYLFLDAGSIFPYLAANAAVPLLTAVLGRELDPKAESVNVLGLTLGYAGMIRATGVGLFLLCLVPLIFGGKIYNSIKAVLSVKVVVVLGFLLFVAITQTTWETWQTIIAGFFKFGTVPTGETSTDNVFVAAAQGRAMRSIDFTHVAMLAAFASIAGSGGLTNAVISNYTRDQGWGMGRHVGAIPSIVGGQEIALSHTGAVFDVNARSLPRWRAWLRHVRRDQIAVWMPACFVGLALPAMLSVQFLQGKVDLKELKQSDWKAPVMTAQAVSEDVAADWGPAWGTGMWYAVVLCGLLVLLPTACQTADGIIRRWVDVLWTASARLREVEPHKIKQLYFRVLLGYAAFGVVTLSLSHSPGTVVKIATNIYNFALGISCFHTLAVNTILLPRELRPGWFTRAGMLLGGVFFVSLATVAAIQTARQIMSA